MSKSKLPKKPDVYLLQNGMYECKTCNPPINIKADGEFQKVSDNPYLDMMMVKVVDDQHVQTASTKEGKDAGKSMRTVSDDGNTLTIAWRYYGNRTGGPVSGTDPMKRVAKGPAGSHLISVSWRNEKTSPPPTRLLSASRGAGGVEKRRSAFSLPVAIG
jgi:hypothetical protein